MKFALAALLAIASATESYKSVTPYQTHYKRRRAYWSPTTTVTSGQAFAKYGERNAVVACQDSDAGLPSECAFSQAFKDQAKACSYGKCGYSKCGYGYGSCGKSYGGYSGSSKPYYSSGVKKTKTAGYAGWEHPSMRLLRSLGKEPEVAGKAWGYAELTTEPCGEGYACGYGCLPPCVEDPVVIEKKEPRIIKMWDNPVFTPNIKTTATFPTLGFKNPGNPVIPAAAPEPVPVKKVRTRKTRPYKSDYQPKHVVETKCDTCGYGSCDPCKTSGAPDDFTASGYVPRYQFERNTNSLW